MRKRFYVLMLVLSFVFVSEAFAENVEQKYVEYLQEATSKFQVGKTAEAREILQKAKELIPDRGDAYFLISLTYGQDEDFMKALEYAYAAVRIAPSYIMVNGFRLFHSIVSYLGKIGSKYGYNKEIVLSEIYYIGKALEILSLNLEPELKSRLPELKSRLMWLINQEASLEKMGEHFNSVTIIDKSSDDLVALSDEDFKAALGIGDKKEVKLPDDGVSIEFKIKYRDKIVEMLKDQ